MQPPFLRLAIAPFIMRNSS